VGTIGYKYIWSHTTKHTIVLKIIDMSGKHKSIQYVEVTNWIGEPDTSSLKVNCPIILDGGILEIKFRYNSDSLFEETVFYDYDCLKEQESELINNILNDMRLMKIQ